jgi:hypothetical protein
VIFTATDIRKTAAIETIRTQRAILSLFRESDCSFNTIPSWVVWLRGWLWEVGAGVAVVGVVVMDIYYI